MKDKISCVYEIINIETGKKYFGSTVDYKRRVFRHKNELRNGTHPNIWLQLDFDKYGESAFKFNILEKGKPSKIKYIEQDYINQNLFDNYNIRSSVELKNLEDIEYIEEDSYDDLIDDDLWGSMIDSDPNLLIDQ